MGAKKLQVVGEEVGRQDYSMRSIEVIPELFQTRAKIDPEVVREFCETIRTGYRLAFPPVLLARTPDGRLILADGFHRHESHHKCRQAAISGIVREVATADEALLFGIEANLNPRTHRRPEEDDRKHSVAMLIRNDEFRTWSDSEIARRCGISPLCVRSIRHELCRSEDIPLPERIKTFTKFGKFTGKTAPYRIAANSGNPAFHIHRSGSGGRSARFQTYSDGKAIDLGTDEEAARKLASGILAEKVDINSSLRQPHNFARWLTDRRVAAAIGEVAGFSAVMVDRDVILVTLADADQERLHTAIGRAYLARKHDPRGRVVVVGFVRSLRYRALQSLRLARSEPDPIEFMEPLEVVARFAPPPDAPGGEGGR